MATVSSAPKQETTGVLEDDEVAPSFLEERRDAEVLKILVRAALWDSEYRGTQLQAQNALDVCNVVYLSYLLDP
jgi:hypothetical protein